MADAIKLYRFDVAGGDLNESSGGERASEAAEIQQGDSDQMRLGDSFQNISCRLASTGEPYRSVPITSALISAHECGYVVARNGAFHCGHRWEGPVSKNSLD